MTGSLPSLSLALTYHKALPARIKQYLIERGVVDFMIDLSLLGWDGRRITIPVFGRDGKLKLFKLAKDPEDRGPGPKMMATPGGSAELYGWERLRIKPKRIIICEGEFDRLLLEGQGLPAVTSTGGAGVFRREWALAFKSIPGVYICFDRDEAGRSGALRVERMIPHARIVELPEEVGNGGDVTDFLVRLGRKREDFLELLQHAQPAPPPERREPVKVAPAPSERAPDDEVARLKARVRIEDVARRYLALRQNGRYYVARCPFHDDHNPSLVVYPDTQSFHCYGCEARGDVISFIRRVEQLSFPEALDVLRKLAP